MPGQIGLVQAAEVLKLILRVGKLLKSRLFVYDALNADFRVFNLGKNKACPLCGENPTITSVGT